VFLSYSRGDRALAEQVIRGLRGLGVDVWWDEDMPGVDWQEELARQIKDLSAVVVLWTPMSSNSKNVRDEARLGQHIDKLVNVLAGVDSPPFPFDRTNGLPLDGWTGREPHNGWTRLVQTVEDHLVRDGAVQDGALASALTAREQAVRERVGAVIAAEEAFQTAKAGEDAAAQAAADGHAALTKAEELLHVLGERRASGTVLHVAEAEIDAARAALASAGERKGAAAEALAEASRRMTRAKRDLDQLLGVPAQAPASALALPSSAVAAPARRDRSNVLPWAIAGAVVVIAGGAWMLGAGRRAESPPVAAPVVAAPVAATPPVDPTAAVAKTLVGDWGGSGATCADRPLKITVTGSALRETLFGVRSSGTVAGLAGAGAIRVHFPDDTDAGGETYAVAGDTLTVTMSGGSMTYQRCDD
jgi:hypothetical protein